MQDDKPTWAWFKPATLQIHGTPLSRVNYEDTPSNFYGFLRCLSWPLFVINLTLSFPLSQHFPGLILPCLAARWGEGGKNAQTCALNFDKEWHPRLIMSRILGQSCLNGGMKIFIKDTKSPGVTGKRRGKRHLPHLSSALVCGILNQHHSAWSWQYNQQLQNTDERKASKRRKTASKALS